MARFVFPKHPGLSTSHGVFAERGDPWVTQRDADADFPLNRTLYPDKLPDSFHVSVLKAKAARKLDKVFAELGLSRVSFMPPRIQRVEVNPDMDCWVKASRAPERREPAPMKSRPSSRTVAQLRAANLNLASPRKAPSVARTTSRPVLDADRLYTAFTGLLPGSASARKTSATGFSVYVLFSDGTEIEKDRKSEEQAMKEAQRMRLRRNVSKVEVWSYETGEMIFEIQGRGRAKK